MLQVAAAASGLQARHPQQEKPELSKGRHCSPCGAAERRNSNSAAVVTRRR